MTLPKLASSALGASGNDGLLRVAGLGVSYGLHRAVADASLSLASQECLALLGTNGAGKTSLLGAISGSVRPVRGRIVLGGKQIDRLPAHDVRRLGVLHVPEGRGIFPSLTVRENLEIMLEGVESAVEVAYDYFPRLRERTNQRAGTMSGGEQQMLALAPAVAGEQQLVMADELSLGLAPVIVDELYEVLADLRTRGTSMILVEQFADRALTLADRAVVLRKGKVVFESDTSRLQDDPDLLHDLYMGSSQ